MLVSAADRGALPQLLPELWREVLSYFRIPAATLLSRQDPSLFRTSHYGDLARFSLVNSTFAELVAPFLYERLHYAVPRTAERWLAGTRSSIRYHSKGKVTPLLRDLTVVGARRHGLDTDQLQNEIMLDCYRNLTRLKLCWITGAQLGAVSFPSKLPFVRGEVLWAGLILPNAQIFESSPSWTSGTDSISSRAPSLIFNTSAFFKELAFSTRRRLWTKPCLHSSRSLSVADQSTPTMTMYICSRD